MDVDFPAFQCIGIWEVGGKGAHKLVKDAQLESSGSGVYRCFDPSAHAHFLDPIAFELTHMREVMRTRGKKTPGNAGSVVCLGILTGVCELETLHTLVIHSLPWLPYRA